MLHVGVYQLHSNFVVHVHAFETIYQYSFVARPPIIMLKNTKPPSKKYISCEGAHEIHICRLVF